MNRWATSAIWGWTSAPLSGEIDFATVRASGRAAVYIRTSVADDYADPNFDANYISARENGLLAGAYHVLTARTPEESRAQARFFAQTVAGRAMQLRPALVFDCLAGLTAANANAIALAFLETVEAELGSAAIRADAETAQSLWRRGHRQPLPPLADGLRRRRGRQLGGLERQAVRRPCPRGGRFRPRRP